MAKARSLCAYDLPVTRTLASGDPGLLLRLLPKVGAGVLDKHRAYPPIVHSSTFSPLQGERVRAQIRTHISPEPSPFERTCRDLGSAVAGKLQRGAVLKSQYSYRYCASR